MGHSLLELVFVLIILGLLASFAIPGFNHYMIRTHRIDGHLALLDLANRMEKYYQEHGTYQRASIQTGTTNDILTTRLSPNGLYQLAITHLSESEYTLQATAIGTQSADKECSTITYDHLGRKGLGAQCWS